MMFLTYMKRSKILRCLTQSQFVLEVGSSSKNCVLVETKSEYYPSPIKMFLKGGKTGRQRIIRTSFTYDRRRWA